MRQGEAHHLHIRKRIHQEHQKYPHPNKFVRNVDRIVYGVSIIFPLTLIPQVWDIFISHSATGISLTTWILSVILGIPMLIYAFVHRIRPIIIMNILWLIMYAFMITGIVLYS